MHMTYILMYHWCTDYMPYIDIRVPLHKKYQGVADIGQYLLPLVTLWYLNWYLIL